VSTGPALYVDIHALHTVPYANLNRDDLGTPKTVYYGGGIRTRVSSQCWKRAIRLAVEERLGQPAARTRRIAIEVAARLRSAGWSAESAQFAAEQVAASAFADGMTLEGGLSTVLLYLPMAAFDELAALCEEHREALAAAESRAADAGKAKPKKGKKVESVLPRDRINDIISSRNGVINLFGRMLAELPSAKVDGAVQVAHAFTTHVAEPEVDFFTAVDDLNPAEETGSGHMNGAEFSAGVFYRYASVNVADLVVGLGDDRGSAAELVAAFLDSFITAMPGAKKNSTAPFTVPDLVYVAARTDRPVSLAAAFEAPVRSAVDGGIALPSRLRLSEYAGAIYRLIGDDGLAYHGHASTSEKSLDNLGARTRSYRELVATAVGHVAP